MVLYIEERSSGRKGGTFLWGVKIPPLPTSELEPASGRGGKLRKKGAQHGEKPASRGGRVYA